MGKGFWDSVNEPCFAIEIDTGNKAEVKELKQEIKELKKFIEMKEEEKLELKHRSMKRINSIDADYELLE